MSTIRQATVEDAEEIATLVNNCYRGDSSRQGWTTEAHLLDGTRTNPDEIRELIQAPDSVLLILLDNSEIIGSVHLQKEPPSSCYLGMLVVKPTLQGAGVGRQVMQAAENFARDEWKADRMTMTVFAVRTELLAFYERRGYRRTGERRPFVSWGTNGIPLVEGLEFEVLEKPLISS
ncbi:MAG TPA: GNAT family N-acetyltransferase [Gemmatimonadaceae bacterium]